MVSATGVYISNQRRSPGGGVKTGMSRYAGVIVLSILALLYIAQASQVSTKSVQAQVLRQEAATLSNDIEQLELESARAQTLDMISTEASPLGLQPIDGVEYLNR